MGPPLLLLLLPPPPLFSPSSSLLFLIFINKTFPFLLHLSTLFWIFPSLPCFFLLICAFSFSFPFVIFSIFAPIPFLSSLIFPFFSSSSLLHSFPFYISSLFHLFFFYMFFFSSFSFPSFPFSSFFLLPFSLFPSFFFFSPPPFFFPLFPL